MHLSRWLPTAALLITTLASLPLGAQRVSPADSAEANRLFAARKWDEAALLYERITLADSTRAGAWMRLGTALDSLGRRADAVRAYEGARRSGGPAAPTLYQLARSHASLGVSSRALAYLDSAAANGYAGFDALRNAREFDSIRGSERYRQALARVETNRYPCRTNAEVRQHRDAIEDLARRVSQTGR